MRRSALALAIAALASCAWAAAPTLPDEGKRVVDQARVLSDGEVTRIADLFAALERACGAQVRVLTLTDLGGEDVFTVAERQFEAWKLGRKGKDDGALILFARDDRKVWVHTGYGLEGALPDGWIGTQVRQTISQYFVGGRYGPGLVHLAHVVVGRIADDSGVKLDRVRAVPAPPPAAGGVSIGTIITILIVIIILTRIFRGGGGGWGGRGGWGGPVFMPMGGGWSGRGGFGGFGGGGGSNSGSFGGGGRTGGGGAGGSW